MSLSATDIEGLLLNGFSCSSDQREFVAKLDPKSAEVVINEMTHIARVSLPLEYVLDEARANKSGSDIKDQADLGRLVGQLAANAI
jgi:hypothetical protein